MPHSNKEQLLSLLFEEGRELVNLKFFAGRGEHSEEAFCGAVHDMISRSIAGEGLDVVPSISRKQQHIGELVGAL